MSVTPADNAAAAPKRRSRRRIVFWCAGGTVLLVFGFFFLLPSICAVRITDRRMACENNLQNIAQALHNYHAEHGSFPPAYVADEKGRPIHSWRVLILPYMEESRLYEKYRFDEPWDGPNNRKLASQMPALFRCPSHRYQDDEFHTSYVAIVGPNSVFPGPDATRLEDISADLKETMLVADVNQRAVHWMSPDDLSPDELLEEIARIGEDTNHADGVRAVFADTSVRLLTSEIRRPKPSER